MVWNKDLALLGMPTQIHLSLRLHSQGFDIYNPVFAL